jgi:hypothetical protein
MVVGVRPPTPDELETISAFMQESQAAIRAGGEGINATQEGCAMLQLRVMELEKENAMLKERLGEEGSAQGSAGNAPGTAPEMAAAIRAQSGTDARATTAPKATSLARAAASVKNSSMGNGTQAGNAMTAVSSAFERILAIFGASPENSSGG